MGALTNETAQQMVIQAIAIAKEKYGRPMCVAVCDEYGFLLAFSRMDGAPVRSIEISQAKAYTSVRMGVPTHEFYARVIRDNVQVSYFGDPRFTALPGGIVIKNDAGVLIGGIGVSALAPAEDQYIVETVVEGLK